MTQAHIDLPETREAIAAGRLVPDGRILLPSGQSIVSKAAIDPVWFLPEIARRFGCTEAVLRQSIFQMTNGMYPEVRGSEMQFADMIRPVSLSKVTRFPLAPFYTQLITRPDIKIFLPPIGGLTIYIWGENTDCARCILLLIFTGFHPCVVDTRS